MDKAQVVRYLRLANDLSAIEGAQTQRVRAHARSAMAIWESPLSIDEILKLSPGAIPGVGPETLAMVRTLQEGGFAALCNRLGVTTPPEAGEFIHLPGIGPKTAHRLVFDFGTHSVADLATALEEGRLRHVQGLGPAKLARLRKDVKVLLQRKESVPIALAWPVAERIMAQLANVRGVRRVSMAGALRRAVVMPTCVTVLAAVENPRGLLEWARESGGQPSMGVGTRIGDPDTTNSDGETPPTTVQFTMAHGLDEVPVCVGMVKPRDFALSLLRWTGDSTHCAVLKQLLAQRGIRWTHSGLQRADGKLQVTDESEVYALAGMPWLPPEVREGEGMLVNPQRLVQKSDIRGDLHVHTTWSDGSQSILEAARQAQALGYEYIAITDHSQSLTIANGLTPERLAEQRREIAQVQAKTTVRILCGSEVDILADGRLDLPDETLASLDIVVASVHSAMHQSKREMTKRILRAIDHPSVTIIGHLTGRKIGQRAGYDMDTAAILDAAKRCRVMIELNSNPVRLDISETPLREAKSRNMLVPLDTDAHHSPEFLNIAYGLRMARRGWLETAGVLNTRPVHELLASLRRGPT